MQFFAPVNRALGQIDMLSNLKPEGRLMSKNRKSDKKHVLGQKNASDVLDLPTLAMKIDFRTTGMDLLTINSTGMKVKKFMKWKDALRLLLRKSTVYIKCNYELDQKKR